jgi:hypothetical protein
MKADEFDRKFDAGEDVSSDLDLEGLRRRIEQLLDDPYALGVGPDITDPDIMRMAWR